MIYLKRSRLCLVATVVCSLVSLTAWGKVLVKESGNVMSYSFDVEGVSYEKISIEDKEFNHVKLNGVDGYQSYFIKVGSPAIPVIKFYVDGLVDSNANFDRNRETAVLPDGLKLAPNQPSLVKKPDKKRAFVMTEGIYNRKAFYPDIDYKIEPAGSIRGTPRTLVTIFPYRYNPVTNEHRISKNISLTFKIQKPKEPTGKKTIAFVVGKNFVDSPSLAKYIQFKQELGYNTQNIIVEPSYTAKDIRAELKKLYANSALNLSYAILVGDAEDVPGYTSSHAAERDDGDDDGLGDDDRIYQTDHYYRAIDTNDYIKDVNGPDIGVGRISIKSEEQLAVILDRYIRYQKGNFSDTSWLPKASFLGSSDEDFFQVSEGTNNYVIDTFTSKKGYFGYFPSSLAENGKVKGGDRFYPKTHSATRQDMAKAARDGRSLFVYTGHGNETGWEDFIDEDVRALKNKNFMPFVLSFACLTARYTEDEVYAELWQRHPAGAIFFWGSYNPSMWDEDDIVERRLFDAIFINNTLEFSAMTHFAMSELWKVYNGGGYSRYYWENYTMFSDPSISLKVIAK